MNCPFCAEEIKDEAAVCKHCGRDLSIPRAVYVEIRALGDRVAALQQEVGRLRVEQGRLRVAASDAAFDPAGHAARRTSPAAEWLAFLVAPFVLLMAIHYLVVFVWDAPLSYLFTASIAVPLGGGLAYGIARRPAISHSLTLAVLLGLAAVVAMLYMTMLLDPHHPRRLISDAWEWREAAQYFATITLSSISGSLLAAMLGHGSGEPSFPPPAVLGLAAAVAGLVVRAEQIEKHAKTLTTIVQAGSTLATSATAIWMGVQVFLK